MKAGDERGCESRLFAYGTKNKTQKTQARKRRMVKCLGAMEQDREAKGPARAGAWAEVGAWGEEVVLGQARVVPAYAQTVGKKSPIRWGSPASTGDARSAGR